GAHSQMVIRLYLAHGVENLAEHALARRPAAYHEAERSSLERRGALRCIEDLLTSEQRILLDVRGGNLRLRAIMAIFRAESALRIQQEVQPYLVGPVVPAHAIRGRKLRQQLVVVGSQYCARRLARYDSAV